VLINRAGSSTAADDERLRFTSVTFLLAADSS
jgi:hypothetical protein